jgi:tRNA(Ile)-lysidine synthase
LIEEGSQIKISIQKLLDYPQAQTLLFETLSIYGFSFDSVSKILECVKGESGRTFFSTSHQLLVDRDVIIIEQLSDNSSEISINNIDDFNNLPISLTAKQYNFDDFKLIKDNSIACLDADKIIYPIKLRKWKTGDYFYPLGMKSKKKISDFFIDQKIDRFTKEKTWLLESTNEIVWIVGLRIDDRYKVTEKTKNVILLKLN